MEPLSVRGALNHLKMRTQQAVSQYGHSGELTPPEVASLNTIALEVNGQPILDIGVGGGRTVKALSELSDDYVGIDYAPEMLQACRERFPERRFVHADARDLTGFSDRSFFLACFSCNGLGMVNHNDRIRILREVYRVLKPGGAFLFSTHNRNCPLADFEYPTFEPSANPARLLVRGVRFLKDTVARVRNRRELKPLEVHHEEYAVLNDVCHNYGTMLYYITLQAQRRQLEQVGFEREAIAYDLSGKLIEADTIDNSILLLARKPIARSRTSTIPPSR